MNNNKRSAFHPDSIVDKDGNLNMAVFEWVDDGPVRVNPGEVIVLPNLLADKGGNEHAYDARQG